MKYRSYFWWKIRFVKQVLFDCPFRIDLSDLVDYYRGKGEL